MWTGHQFAERHNHGLTPAQGLHAAHIANAVLRRTGDEGMSIAVANKLARHLPHRQDGGMTQAVPGLAPNVANQQPNVMGLLQRFAAMSPEQLQELVTRLPPSMAQLAQRVLQQKRMMPQQAAAQTQPQQALPQFGVAAAPQALPQAAPVQPPVQPQPGLGYAAGGGMTSREVYAHGGMKARDDPHVPILAAGGEFVVSPHHVARLGRGDIKEGHRWLDDFVVRARKDIVDTMKHLKPPVKS